MPFDALFTLLLLLGAILILSSQRLRADLTALLVMLALILSGVLRPEDAFVAFGQPVIVIVASVFVIGATLTDTGVGAMLAQRLMRVSRAGTSRLVLTIMIIAGLMSAVLTGLVVVAVLMPVVLRITRQIRVAPGQLLLPLATAATVGNQLTLIGTTSNLVVNDLLSVSGHPPFGFFTLTPYALASLTLTILWYLLAGRPLLPEELPDEPEQPTLGDVGHSYRLKDLFYRLRVRSSSDLIGQRLDATPLSADFDLTIIYISRDGEQRAVVPEDVLEQDDLLVVEGRRGDIFQAASRHSMELKGRVGLNEVAALAPETVRWAEVIVPYRSQLIGRTLAEIDFRDRYGLNVVALHRQGKASRHNLGELKLLPGDTLLVEGPVMKVQQIGRDLNLVCANDLGPFPGEHVTGKAGLAIAILVAMILLIVSGTLSLAPASLAAVLALILTGCIGLERAYESVDTSMLVLIGGMFSLAIALQRSGAAELVAGAVAALSPVLGTMGILALLYLFTTIVTQMVSNSVTAAMMTPIAINLAVAQGLSPIPFAIAVIFAVNSAYISPLTDGNNLLVRESGHYQMRHYLANNFPVFLLQASVVFFLLFLQL